MVTPLGRSSILTKFIRCHGVVLKRTKKGDKMKKILLIGIVLSLFGCQNETKTSQTEPQTEQTQEFTQFEQRILDQCEQSMRNTARKASIIAFRAGYFQGRKDSELGAYDAERAVQEWGEEYDFMMEEPPDVTLSYPEEVQYSWY